MIIEDTLLLKMDTGASSFIVVVVCCIMYESWVSRLKLLLGITKFNNKNENHKAGFSGNGVHK